MCYATRSLNYAALKQEALIHSHMKTTTLCSCILDPTLNNSILNFCPSPHCSLRDTRWGEECNGRSTTPVVGTSERPLLQHFTNPLYISSSKAGEPRESQHSHTWDTLQLVQRPMHQVPATLHPNIPRTPWRTCAVAQLDAVIDAETHVR